MTDSASESDATRPLPATVERGLTQPSRAPVEMRIDPRGRLLRTPRRIGLALLLLVALPLIILIALSSEALLRRAAMTETELASRADGMLDEVSAEIDAAVRERLGKLGDDEAREEDPRHVEVSPSGRFLMQPRTGYRRVPGPLPPPLPPHFSESIERVLALPGDEQLSVWSEMAERQELPRHRAIIKFRRAVCMLRSSGAEHSVRQVQAELEALLDHGEVWDSAGMPLSLYVHLYLAEALVIGGEPYQAARILINLERDLALDAWLLETEVAGWHHLDTAHRFEDILVRIPEEEQREFIERRRTEIARQRDRVLWGKAALRNGLVSEPAWRGRRLDDGHWLFHKRSRSGSRLLYRISTAELDGWVGAVLERHKATRQARFATIGAPIDGPEVPYRQRSIGGLLAELDLGVTPYGLEAQRDSARRRSLLHALLLGMALIVIFGGLLTGYRFLCREVEAARSKEAFLASISHELRTPLTSIRIFAESLADGGVPDQKIQQYAGQIDREARRLTRLIEGVLDLAALERGEVQLAIVPLSVHEVFDEAVMLFHHRADDRGELVVEAGTEELLVGGDLDALVQVLRIALDNAAKYGPPGGQIALAASPLAGGRVEITIDDQGPGVPPEERRRVTERFYRGQHTGGIPGLGLGLAIAATLTRAMNGEIEIAESPDGGTRVCVRLDAATRPALDTSAEPPAEGEV